MLDKIGVPWYRHASYENKISLFLPCYVLLLSACLWASSRRHRNAAIGGLNQSISRVQKSVCFARREIDRAQRTVALHARRKASLCANGTDTDAGFKCSPRGKRRTTVCPSRPGWRECVFRSVPILRVRRRKCLPLLSVLLPRVLPE